MRRVFRLIKEGTSGGNDVEAEPAANSNRTTDAPVDDTAWGLSVWVEGVNPEVE